MLDGSGTLTFKNAAVTAGVAKPPESYETRWFAFDNATGSSKPIGTPVSASGERAPAPSGLPTGAGAFVRVDIAAVNPPHPSWTQPVSAYFRRTGSDWKLVGFERLPDKAATNSTK
jgi:hypothetical protein